MVSKLDTSKIWIFALTLSFFTISCGGGGVSGTQTTPSNTDTTSSSGTDSSGTPTPTGTATGGTPIGGTPTGGTVIVPPPAPPAGNSVYKVYSGCEIPGTTFSRDVYVDAAVGVDSAGRGAMTAPYKTLSYLESNKLIRAGDHIIVNRGTYSALNISNTTAPALATSSLWTWFDFKPGALVSGATFAQVSRVLLTGASISKSSGTLLSSTGTMQFIAADNSIYSSTANPDTLSIAQWLALGNGVNVRDGNCNSIYRNQIRNVRFGIAMYTNKATYPANSMKGLVEENDLKGFSGDASRGIGSDLAFINNQFVDGYASIADGDANHDDMFQGYALNGAVFENLLIEGNFMLDRSSGTRSFTSGYQGISIFDGLYKNVVVRKNIVVTGAYHGIAMYGIDDVLIEYNTLASTSGKTLWVGLFNSKTGVAPINNVVRNNLAHLYSGMNLATSSVNNLVVANPAMSYQTFNLMTGSFDLHLKNTDANYGKNAGAL